MATFSLFYFLPDWYEGDDAGRARQLQVKLGCTKKLGKLGSLWEFQEAPGYILGCWDPGQLTNRRKTRKNEGSFREFGRRAPGAQLRELSTGYPQEIYDRGVWEFDTIFVKSRSAMGPSYSPGTWNTLLWPSSLVLHP